MTTLPRPFYILFGALLSVTAAGTEANVGEYKWGKTVCTPTLSSDVRNPLTGQPETLLYAPTASCRCEKETDPEEQGKVVVQTDMTSLTVTVFRIEKDGKKLLWEQMSNCKILSPTNWDCSYRYEGNIRYEDPREVCYRVRRLSSQEGLFLLSCALKRSAFVEVVGTIRGSGRYGSCILKRGWSLKGLISK
jgi:hypothetical protein